MSATAPIFIGPDGLAEFADVCAEALFSGVHYCFLFPAETTLQHWPVEKIKETNEPFLKSLRNRANLYCIYIRLPGEDDSWRPVYVGERKSIGLRDRITQHLINKNHRTGSMLEGVKMAVASGQQIGLSFVKVEPESLRLYVEEHIISACKRENKLPWNSHG